MLLLTVCEEGIVSYVAVALHVVMVKYSLHLVCSLLDI